MKTILIIISTVIIHLCSLANQTDSSEINIDKKLVRSDINEELQSTPRNIHQDETEHSSTDPFKDYAPWVVALLIGGISSFVNYRISKRTRESNEQSLYAQLKSSEAIAVNNIRGTISSKNRQDWINEVRLTLSQFITQSFLMSIEMLSNENVDQIRMKKILENLFLSRSQLFLLLNTEKPLQKELMVLVDDMIELAFKNEKYFDGEAFEKKSNEIENVARKLLSKHWEKIKAIQ